MNKAKRRRRPGSDDRKVPRTFEVRHPDHPELKLTLWTPRLSDRKRDLAEVLQETAGRDYVRPEFAVAFVARYVYRIDGLEDSDGRPLPFIGDFPRILNLFFQSKFNVRATGETFLTYLRDQIFAARTA